jgi:hypothetical protein
VSSDLLLFRYLGPLSDRLQPRTDICNFPAPKAALTTANRACSERSKLSAAMLSSRIRLVRISVSAQLGIQDMINLSWKLAFVIKRQLWTRCGRATASLLQWMLAVECLTEPNQRR